MFVEENVNPNNKKTGDCVIRAIAKAENKSWLEIFDILTDLARKNFTTPTNQDCYYEYLSKYEKIPVYHIKYNKKRRYTVKEICKMKGTYLIRVAGHMTVVINGKNYDTWDCGESCAYVIWKVK